LVDVVDNGEDEEEGNVDMNMPNGEANATIVRACKQK
jgi:hypothetical protein